MSEMFLKEIHSAAKNGAKFYVGRNYYGRTRLKIVQCRTTRITTNIFSIKAPSDRSLIHASCEWRIFSVFDASLHRA
jgi:hypothetical protein